MPAHTPYILLHPSTKNRKIEKTKKKEKENIPPSSLDAGVVPSSPYENLNSLPALALAYCE
jgi:hypothetical protein